MSRIKIGKCVKTEKTCLHTEQVEDADNSYFICTECGIQLQQIFHRAYNNYEVVQCDKNNIYEFIDNCARRLNLPDCMTKEIFDHFMKIKVKKAIKMSFTWQVIASTIISYWQAWLENCLTLLMLQKSTGMIF